jgi:hypothetical protein
MIVWLLTKPLARYSNYQQTAVVSCVARKSFFGISQVGIGSPQALGVPSVFVAPQTVDPGMGQAATRDGPFLKMQCRGFLTGRVGDEKRTPIRIGLRGGTQHETIDGACVRHAGAGLRHCHNLR